MSIRATEFIIWRAGASVDWDCTQSELAAETGFSVKTIGDTLKRKGWKCRNNRRSGAQNRPRVDLLVGGNAMAQRREDLE